jgi:hypothetical protein
MSLRKTHGRCPKHFSDINAIILISCYNETGAVFRNYRLLFFCFAPQGCSGERIMSKVIIAGIGLLFSIIMCAFWFSSFFKDK